MSPVVAESLTYIYNLSIYKNDFPEALKQAKVIPILKSGDPLDPSNYRPISILSVLSKPLENHINKHILAHVNKYDLLHPNQSGFRANHSCHTALTHLVDQWLTNIKDKEINGVIFVDFAKAFDVIDHTLLTRKLAVYNLSQNTIELINSFLSNRHQLVSINTIQSTLRPQHYGVPQGSILGPLLFSLYVNDLPLSINNSKSEMFADDTTIHTSHHDITNISNQLQESMNQMIKWTEQNHMALNSQKTKCMLITTKEKRQTLTTTLPPIYINNNSIEEVDSHLILGVTIHKNMSWKEHLANLSKQVGQKVSQLSQMKHFLNLHARKQFFYAHIHSVIDYASTLWDKCPDSSIRPLRRSHKRAIKQILLKSTSLSTEDYKTLEILPLNEKLLLNKAVLMHKIYNKQAPKPLLDNCPQNENRHTHNDFGLCSKPRINLYKTSLCYAGGALWNSLPQHLRDIQRRDRFTRAYKAYMLSTLV